MLRTWLFILAFSLLAPATPAQRVYKANSVLSSGLWYKFAVRDPGLYRIDVPFLQSLGINTAGLSSSSIRIYGNGGQMLPEPCNGFRIDDLAENAIDVEDGGDGLFNGSDYILFYASGPDAWVKDSVNRGFGHVENLYGEESVYFLGIGVGAGKRVAVSGPVLVPNITVTGFDERWFYELDSINFLSSGKDWYGAEFASMPGSTVMRSFAVPAGAMPHLDSSQPMNLVANCVARSIGTGSRFNLAVNNAPVLELDIPATTDGNYDVFAKGVQSRAVFQSAQSALSVNLTFTPGAYNAQGWLDWLELSGRGLLSIAGLNQFAFRDWNSVGSGHKAGFTLQGAGTATRVWDITDPTSAQEMQGVLTGTAFSFVGDASQLHEYIAFNNTGSATGFLTPRAIGRVANQNLHAAPSVMPQMLIVTDPSLLAQADRLELFHLQEDPAHIRAQVVTTTEIYNEFASGSADPTAIRDYVKMFYDRSGGDSTKRPRWLLLLGAASFDYKNRLVNNTNLVPAYESASSLDPLTTYCSDDFYGFLQDGDDVNNLNAVNLLDIGIGRIPARSPAEAAAVVDKLTQYASPASQGPWRNEFNLIADDGDENLHFQDAEAFAATVGGENPIYNIDKVYLDAFPEVNTPAGGRYPQVNQTIAAGLYSGTLVWNYTGHGSSTRLSNEDVLDQSTINTFANAGKLPLFITATCDFAPYDNPLIASIGANLLVRPSTGAIALMTTTRLVFAFSNKAINNNYLGTAFTPRSDGSYFCLGDAERLAKNFTYTTQTDAVNNRKFTLLGDPALTLAFPRYKVQTTTINGVALVPPPGSPPGPPIVDTLKALNQYTIGGVVVDNSGALLTGFTGTLYATVYDKPHTLTTLGNNPGSVRVGFEVQDNVLYKGKAQVVGGQFSFSFVVPKDINYQFGHGKISYYAGTGSGATGSGGGGSGSFVNQALSGVRLPGAPAGGSGAGTGAGTNVDAGGAFTNFLIGGSGGGVAGAPGPAIQAYLNDEKFVDGGITNQDPILILHLADSVGINIVGTGIGHDITAILDNDIQNPFVLNSFYEADLNTFKRGTVRYPLPTMTNGEHVLMIKAWDAANNSGQVSVSFRVVQSQSLTLDHVLNYPDPFTTHTTFWFEHNRPGEDLSVLVQVFTVSGKLVKSIRRTINTPGNRSSEIEWDGRDDYGSRIAKGVYIYRLRVRATDGSVVEKLEKLFML